MMEKQKSIWTIIDDGVRTMYFFGSHNEPLEESTNGELMALAMEYFVEAKKFKGVQFCDRNYLQEMEECNLDEIREGSHFSNIYFAIRFPSVVERKRFQTYLRLKS